MTPLFRNVIAVVIGAAIIAGGSGVLMAVGTQADVDTLKTDQVRVEQRLVGVETKVAELKGATEVRAEADKEYRVEQRQQLHRLDGKLDELLRK